MSLGEEKVDINQSIINTLEYIETCSGGSFEDKDKCIYSLKKAQEQDEENAKFYLLGAVHNHMLGAGMANEQDIEKLF